MKFDHIKGVPKYLKYSFTYYISGICPRFEPAHSHLRELCLYQLSQLIHQVSKPCLQRHICNM